MQRNIIILFMDDIKNRIRYSSDSSLLLGYEAQQRGYEVIYSNINWLALDNYKPVIYGKNVTLFKEDPYFRIESEDYYSITVNKIKIILLRQNPPCNSEFMSNISILKELNESRKICMVNKPSVLAKFNEKLIPGMLDQNIVKVLPSLVTSDMNLAHEFLKQYGKCVLKPLHACSGMGVITVSLSEKNFVSSWNLLKYQYAFPIMIQKFIDNSGDKRVIISNGKILGAMKRVPSDYDFRSNLCLEAYESKVVLSDNEILISNEVAKFMLDNDITWSGIDLIDDHLIEVNITSPTGLKNINNLYNLSLEQILWDDIELISNQFYGVSSANYSQ